jgi:ABC-type antimicrobial peptide transport system permease subunit
VSKLYSILVFLTTGIAILISFMILTNLANIYMMRKKTELSVMRINGFSIRQTKAYLSRETVFTTLIGLILGVAAGALVTPYVIRLVQQPDLEFIKSFSLTAWGCAVGLETLFAVVINSFVFRKVKDLNLRDIT